MWIPIASVGTEVDENGLACEVSGAQVALFRVGGCLYATSNVCTHQFALMTEGSVDGEYVECPMHQGRFHIPTGAAQGVPVSKPLETYPLRIEGDQILIDLTSEKIA